MDRLSKGPRWSPYQIAKEVAKHYPDWRGVTIVSIIMAESGGYEWIRPMVFKDNSNDPAHLSTDRGLCQFNSYWWADAAPDSIAFNGKHSIELMCNLVAGDDGKWGLDEGRLRWWNAYSRGLHTLYASAAREGMNQVLSTMGKSPI